MRKCILDMRLLIVQGNLLTVRRDLFTIVAVGYNRFYFGLISLIRTQIESRTPSVTCDDQRQTFDHIAREIGTFGVDSKHTIWQMDGWVGWHQQVTNVSHIRVYIVHRLFACPIIPVCCTN